MRSSILVLLGMLLCCFPRQVLAQSPPEDYSRNSIYLEALGQGLLYSVNYDYRFVEHGAIRLGATHFILPDFFIGTLNITAFPVMAEYLLGGRNDFLEVGLGIIPVYGTFTFEFGDAKLPGLNAWVLFGTGTVGYRHQPSGGGFMFRLGITPFFTRVGSRPYGGLSLGYAF